MPWSKGAVVIKIKKHGDEEWADTIEKSLNIKRASDKELKELEELRRDNTFMKKHIVDDLEAKIADAEAKYGRNWIPPKWMKPIVDVISLIEYGFAILIDKVSRGE